LGVQDLVEVRQAQPSAVDLDHLRLAWHVVRVTATPWSEVERTVCTGVMRSIWKGALTFGLVNVPVKVYSATEDHDVSLHQVHDEDGGRIRYKRTCEVCGQVIAYQNIDRAYEDDGQMVVLTKDD